MSSASNLPDDSDDIIANKEADEVDKSTHRAKDVRTPFHGRPMESHLDYHNPTVTPKE